MKASRSKSERGLFFGLFDDGNRMGKDDENTYPRQMLHFLDPAKVEMTNLKKLSKFSKNYEFFR